MAQDLHFPYELSERAKIRLAERKINLEWVAMTYPGFLTSVF